MWMVFTSKMCEKHLSKSDILSKDAGHRPVFLIFGTVARNSLST